MGRLMHRLTFLFYVFTCVSAQQYYIRGSRPYIILPSESALPGQDDTISSSEFFARSGIATSSEEESVEKEEVQIVNRNLSAKVPPKFSEEVNRNRRFPPRPVSELKADPGTMDPDDEVVDEQGSRGMSRFLWPFSVSVTKTKGVHGDYEGHGPAPHMQYYNHYPKKAHRGHSNKKYNPLTDEFQGLTKHDYKVLNSKGYKKYRKKKKKKIKKLKKALKLKRVLQKILEKKITYFDGLTSEYY